MLMLDPFSVQAQRAGQHRGPAMRKLFLIMNPQDNVGVAVYGGQAGSCLSTQTGSSVTLLLTSDIPPGHKAALADIPQGAPLIKYGEPIGFASRPIRKGEHVHVHNVAFDRNMQFDRSKRLPSSRLGPVSRSGHFQGYLRTDGSAGVRNYITVVSSSNCAASVVKQICRLFPSEKLATKHIDGIVPVVYSHGCALAIDGAGYETLSRTLAGWVDHPNVVGSLLVSLGCDSINCRAVEVLARPDAPLLMSNTFRSFSVQDAGGYAKAVQRGLSDLNDIIDAIRPQERIQLPVSNLKIALNCGGSDAFSGITANPAVGAASDLIVAEGGTVALAEIPECYGAEEQLMARCVHEEDRGRIKRFFQWWSAYAAKNGIEINDNISKGNIEGGLTTILEKSLGAITKGGTSPITQAVDYANKISEPGLVLMNTPGFDPVSMTGLIAGGCVMGLFTTGRGSLYGCSIAPVLKISTTTTLFEKMRDDIDINAGLLLEDTSMGAIAGTIYSATLATASGEKTASERNQIGLEEFVPWNPGETL
jgi:altronate hydrolase